MSYARKKVKSGRRGWAGGGARAPPARARRRDMHAARSPETGRDGLQFWLLKKTSFFYCNYLKNIYCNGILILISVFKKYLFLYASLNPWVYMYVLKKNIFLHLPKLELHLKLCRMAINCIESCILSRLVGALVRKPAAAPPSPSAAPFRPRRASKAPAPRTARQTR